MEESEFQKGIANALSTITILSCLFLKVPQIMYIWKRKCADGIYAQAMVMEIIGFSIVTLYNYTNQYGLLTYLEYPIILLQVYVLFYLVLKYQDRLDMPIVPIAAIIYFVLVIGFVTHVLPNHILSVLVPFCTPLSGFAKVTYIYGIVTDGNADSVSLTTWVISVATNLARIYTVFVDSADKNLLFNFSISCLLSTSVLLTAFYYQKCRECAPPPQRRRKYSRRCSHNHYD